MVAGYAAEMRRIDDDLAALAGAGDPEAITRRLYRLYQKASIAGDLAGLAEIIAAIDNSITALANPGDLYVLKAHTAFKLHRLADVASALRAVPSVYNSDEGRLIRADLDFQHGYYQTAEIGYLDVLQCERSWGALARLAHLRGKMGDASGADRLYEEAQDQLTAKEMRPYAWLEVQRGLLDFAHGRSEGGYEEAAGTLERIVSTIDRPDLDQAIGELYELAGQSRPALHWKERALSGYSRSVQRGEVHFYHHLVDYYTDVEEDGAEAVKWAYKDLQLRGNFATQAALAWALYRAGQFSDAVDWIDRALASGVVDARLCFRASEIYRAAGKAIEARNLRARATALNPAVAGFHVHH